MRCAIMVIMMFVLFWGQTKAQGRYDANWVFGCNCGLQFDDTLKQLPIQVKNVYGLSTSFGSIDDFVYFDSGTIRNGFGDTILNGNAIKNFDIGFANSQILNFKDSLQSLLVAIYDFGGASCPHLLCLNVSLNSIERAGADYIVAEKNVRLVTSPIDNKIYAVKHSNGIDWWLLAHQMQLGVDSPPTNRFFKFLINVDSVLGPYTQDIGTFHTKEADYFGDIVVNADGVKIASTITEKGVIDIFDFDRCTGDLSNHSSINSSSQTRYSTVEFSPNSRFLYATTGRGYDENALYQFDLNAGNIGNSRIKLWGDPDANQIRTGDMKLAPDGKIYITAFINDSTVDEKYRSLSVINSPDSLGSACNFQPFSFMLDSTCRLTFDLPNIPNYNLGATSIFQADAGVDTFLCINDTTEKGALIGADPITGVEYNWQNTEIDAADKDKSKLLVTPNQTTWYYLELTDTSIVGSCQTRMDSVLVEVIACTGLKGAELDNVQVFPNPTQGFLQISIPQSQHAIQFQLFTLLGKAVLQQEIEQSTSVDISSLTPGVYLYQLSSHGSTRYGKLVVE